MVSRRNRSWAAKARRKLTPKTVGLLTGSLLLVFIVFNIGSCSWFRPSADEPATPETVWRYIQQEAPKVGLDPYFVYAIVMAESTLNAGASSGYARGIMQLSEGAWQTVSDESYRQAWNWKKNIDAGIAYLVHCRTLLRRSGHDSYPLLAASYRYGPNHVRRAGFNLSRINKPTNRIYQQLFAGNIRPVEPPQKTASAGNISLGVSSYLWAYFCPTSTKTHHLGIPT
jgi:hypothetical protein